MAPNEAPPSGQGRRSLKVVLRGWRQGWHKTSIANKLSVFLTLIICVATVVNVRVFVRNVDQQDRQADKLIVVAQTLNESITNGMTKNREALDAMIDQQKETLNATLAQSKASSDASIKATTDGLSLVRENFTQEQRPYIGVYEVPAPSYESRRIVWGWYISNYGRTPGQELRISQGMNVGDGSLFRPQTMQQLRRAAAPIPPGKHDYIVSRSPATTTKEEFDRLNTSDGGMVAYGKIEYMGIDGEKYETGYCFFSAG